MRNGIMRITALLLLALGFSACNQDPIFYTISREIAPRDPRIPGGPVNYAVSAPAGTKLLFAASGKKLHWYRDGGWDNRGYGITQPGGRIKYLAATDDRLFAICYSDSAKLGSPSLKQLGADGWTTLAFADSAAQSYPLFQSIYAANNILFIAATRNSSAGTAPFAILYAEVGPSGAGQIKMLSDLSGELRGAVFDASAGNYYLCTKEKKVYVLANSPAGVVTTLTGTVDSEFMGMTGINDPAGGSMVAAITRDGSLYYISSSDIAAAGLDMGKYATSALAVWEDPSGSSEQLLLVGKQDSLNYSTSSGYTYGYREFRYAGGSSLGKPHEPGVTSAGGLTSADDNERYISTIGKHQVNFIFQTPRDVDANMPLFASTQKNGVWSYRHTDKDPQWNAE